ncbi:MAG: ABC transporter ATP-binding protein [Bacilli bacterium]|nr:ABC transporter ATP-binding protein [Bacilli bacterium]
MEKEVLLEVKDLHTSFNVPSGEVRSVNGVSFTLRRGEVLGIVGESGSGKSVTAYSVMQILEKPGRVIGGSIKFKGQELLGLPNKQLQRIRGKNISIIFQDSMSSLNPVWSIGNQLREAVKIHEDSEHKKNRKARIAELKAEIKAKETEFANNPEEKEKTIAPLKQELHDQVNFAQKRALEMLRLVGINEPEKRLKQYPFEHSGGMLQRVMIAMALINEPDLIIADEPTTALDVTIQAQILELLIDLQKRLNVGIIIITHDLGVVAQICHRVNVMYAGRIVETGTVDDIFYNPQHEYTKGLINSIPKAGKRADKLEPIPGNPVDVFTLPSGCSFAPRCKNCMKVCLKKFPKFIQVGDDHYTACFKYLEKLYQEGKIKEEDFDKYIDSCEEGNKAFSRISRLDVEKAYQDYLSKKAENTAKIGDNASSKDEIEAARYQIRDAKLEYRRAKRDFAYAIKERHTGGKERLSIDKNDVHKKIKHHKVEIGTKAPNMSADEFNAYLETLVISTTPVNPNASKEAVQEAKNNLKVARKNYAAQKKVSREEKVKALTEIDAAKEKVAQSKRDLVWFNYIEKKMLSTKKALARIYEKKKGE